MFFGLDMLVWSYGSTGAVPFLSMLAVLTLWFGISVPLVFLGAYFGYKRDAIEFPVITSNIPRQIPTQPWYLNPLLTCLLGGILPFGACFVELFFIMSSIWMDQVRQHTPASPHLTPPHPTLRSEDLVLA